MQPDAPSRSRRRVSRRRTAAAPLTVALAIVAVAMPSPSSPQTPAPPPADPADVESIDAIMKAVYEVISGDAGVPRDWDRFRSLFAPGATLNPTRLEGERYQRAIITPDEYAERAGPSLESAGFHEIEIHRVTEQYGVIAHAFSTYESRRLESDPEPFARGINSFQLLHDGSRWWVVSIFWLGESEDHPIPAKYLPGNG